MRHLIDLLSLEILLILAIRPASTQAANSSKDVSLNYDDDSETWYQNWSNHDDPIHDSISYSYDEGPFSSDLTALDIDDSDEGQEYQVHLNTNSYWQKYQKALLNHDAVKADKNRVKYDLLVNDDFQGMNRLVDNYDREYRQTREENVIHRSKAGRNRTLSKQWGDLACALTNAHHEPIGMQLDRSTGTADEAERKQRNELYAKAQEEASLLVHYWPLADFNLTRSEKQVEDKKIDYRMNRNEENKRKWKKAIKFHNHRINALMHRSADDANALALYYGDKRVEHKKALKVGEERADRVKIRGNAWRDRADEIEKRIKR